MKIVSVVGARPQFIKLSAIVRALERREGNRPDHVIVHTGQHYDYEMSQTFFNLLALPTPDFHLGVGSGCHGFQTGRMLEKAEGVLTLERPDLVMVYGDTNSTLAGALAAAKLHMPVAHVEAGLRSSNRRMPEELNRVLTDHTSDILFCPSERAVENLRREGFVNIVNDGRLVKIGGIGSADFCLPVVVNVGDVMYDALLACLEAAGRESHVLEHLSLEQKGYYVATVHRAENTDDSERLKKIIAGLTMLSSRGPVVMPTHPRTRGAIEKLGGQSVSPTSKLRLIPPLGYFDMLWLEKNARAILTDSGGVQKEAYWMDVPCFTLREETEWPETVEARANTLVGAEPERIAETASRYEISNQSLSPGKSLTYGDGHAAERILQVVSHER